MLAFLFALQSKALLLLPLASALGKASKGSWNRERTVFTVAEKGLYGVSMDSVWELETVRFAGSNIASFHFAQPFPLVGVHSGKGFLPGPAACSIPVIAKIRFAQDRKLLELSGKDSSHLSPALRDWEAVMGTLSAELRIVLEGRFAISRAELPLVQVVCINHPSWENNPEARAALWPVLAQNLIMGRFEYVQEGDPLPLAILPIGAVPKSTFP